MARQETSLRDQEAAPEGVPGGEPRVSLVVDRPPEAGRALLILPFASAEAEGALGRQIGAILQRRLRLLSGITAGHGLLVMVSAHERRYMQLSRALSADQALACGASWGADAVVYGTIGAQQGLRWAVALQDVASGAMLFEDTLIGDLEDLLDAPGSVATVVAQSLHIDLDEVQEATLDERESEHPEAMLAYLSALDLRPQQGVTVASPEAMRRYLLKALILDPTCAVAGAMLTGDLEAGPDNPWQVAPLIEEARTHGAAGEEGLERLAVLLDERGHAAQAGRLAGALLERDGANPVALELAAQQAYQAGHFERARGLAGSLMDLHPEGARAYELLGNLLAAAGRFPGAAQYWELALERDPERTKLMMRLGNYLSVAGDYQRAYTLLQRAAALGTATPDSLYQLGVAAYRLGLVEEAIDAMRRTVERDPNRAQAHAMLARCYVRAGQTEQALLHDARALQLAPLLWPSALAIGHAALKGGQAEQALTAYTQAARQRPDSPDALYGLGVSLVENGLIHESVEVLYRARQLRPKDPNTLCALATAFDRGGDRAGARQFLAAAERVAPGSAIVARYRAALDLPVNEA